MVNLGMSFAELGANIGVEFAAIQFGVEDVSIS